MSGKVSLHSGCLHYKCCIFTTQVVKHLHIKKVLLVFRGAGGVQPTAAARRRQHWVGEQRVAMG